MGYFMRPKNSLISRTSLADRKASCEVPESQKSLFCFTRPTIGFYEEAVARINKVERHGKRTSEKVRIGQQSLSDDRW